MFEEGSVRAQVVEVSGARYGRRALVQRPVRNQGLLPGALPTLDGVIGADHPVRALWQVVDELDLTALEAQYGSNADSGGRPSVDVRILLAVWLYATTQGEARASVIAERCLQDAPYVWLCGGVRVGERTLSGFRAGHEAQLDALLTQLIAVLMQEDLVEVWRTAQDGTRVRASASSGSFHRLGTMERAYEQAQQHLVEVKAAAADPRRSKVARAAAERGAQERIERIAAAMERVREVAAHKKLDADQLHDVKKAPRASTTDPDATVMKMGDGGFRPAYNVQFATAADRSGVIVGVEVTTRGTDQGQMPAMLEQVHERTGVRPEEHLVDKGYASHQAIEAAAEAGTLVFAPLPTKLAEPGSRRDGEYSEQSRAWIERMQTEQGKAIYKLRSEVAELSNARAKATYGLAQLFVRGLVGVTCCALLVALANNVERLISLRAQAQAVSSMTRS